MILAALVIGVQLALVAFGPRIEAAEPVSQRIAVAPFRAVTGIDATSISDGLVIDLQHVLIRQLGITVIDSSDPQQLKGSKRLTGTVSTTETAVRVAVTLTDFDSGVVAWSAVIEQPRAKTLGVTANLAQEIAAALPVPGELPIAGEVSHAAE